MPERPLLLFPQPTTADRDKRPPSPPPSITRPSIGQQKARIAPKLDALNRALDSKRARLQSTASGTDIEQVIVFETIGTVDRFLRAVEKVPGLEWLAEFSSDEIAEDEFFRFADPADTGKTLNGTVYLVMENAQGMAQLLNLWRTYQARPGAKFDTGLTPFRYLFEQLRDVRQWSPLDRIRETGIEESWREQIELGGQAVRFEAELWHRENADQQQKAIENIRAAITAAGGRIITSASIGEIRYHAVLAELPPNPVADILERIGNLSELPETSFIRAEDVMFFRPTPQCISDSPEPSEVTEAPLGSGTDGPRSDPIVALLDGMPIENHQRLAGRLIVDDPDNFAEDCLASHRSHGTAMASLIVNGDLVDGSQPLATRLYVRPILKPRGTFGRYEEATPTDTLPLDLLYRSFRRMFVGDSGSPPTAPTVKVVNLSVGDLSRPFIRELSPWARLLDWAATTFNILINVSCGNYGTFAVQSTMTAFRNLSLNERAEKVFRYCHDDSRHRRLLSPSEAVNALCIGAVHADSTQVTPTGYQVELCPPGFPSPMNARGGGYLRSIKPELLLPGGRQLYNSVPKGSNLELRPLPYPSAPGQLVAMPSQDGSPRGVGHTRGSSNATALASRAAGRLYEMLLNLRRSDPDFDAAVPEYGTAALLKALLVHGAVQPQLWRQLSHFAGATPTEQEVRRLLSAYGGYGEL